MSNLAGILIRPCVALLTTSDALALPTLSSFPQLLRHPREGGDPEAVHMDSRLRGNDGGVMEAVQ